MKILVIAPGKVPVVQEINDTLSELQDVVGGLIEVRYPFVDPVALVCNEEGKNLGLKPNRYICTPTLRDIICGTFFLVGSLPGDENFSSLPDKLILRYAKIFKAPHYFAMDGNRIMVFHD